MYELPFVQLIAGAVGKQRGPIADVGAAHRESIEWILMDGPEDAVEALISGNLALAIRLAAKLSPTKPQRATMFEMEYQNPALIAATATDLGIGSHV